MACKGQIVSYQPAFSCISVHQLADPRHFMNGERPGSCSGSIALCHAYQALFNGMRSRVPIFTAICCPALLYDQQAPAWSKDRKAALGVMIRY